MPVGTDKLGAAGVHSTLHGIHVNVKAFGALGNGSHDDTQNIRDAITAATSSGGSVFFPPGNYKVTSTIDISAVSNVALHMVGGNSNANFLVGQFPPAANIVGTTITGGPVFLCDRAGGTANHTWENLGINGGLTAIKYVEAGVARFINCTFQAANLGGANNTAVLCEDSFWFWYDYCSFVAPSQTLPSVILRGNAVPINAPTSGLQRFHNCTFWSRGVQVEQLATPSSSGNWFFENCIVENALSTAILKITESGPAGGYQIHNLVMINCEHADAGGTPVIVELDAPFAQLWAPVFIGLLNAGNFAIKRVNGTVNNAQFLGSGRAPRFSLNSAGTATSGDFITYKDVGLDIVADELGTTNMQVIDNLGVSLRLARPGESHAQTALSSASGTGLLFGAGSGAADTNLYRTAAGALQTDGVVREKKATPTYSASITPNAAAGDWQTITVTNGTAFTINAPSTAPASTASQELTIEILNSSGGAMGAVTWNGAFLLVGGAFTNPANTKKRFIRFEWNGVNWVEISRAGADY